MVSGLSYSTFHKFLHIYIAPGVQNISIEQTINNLGSILDGAGSDFVITFKVNNTQGFCPTVEMSCLEFLSHALIYQ